MSPNRYSFTLVMGAFILLVGVFGILRGGRSVIDAWNDASSIVDFGARVIAGAPLWASALVLLGVGNLLALVVWPWLKQRLDQQDAFQKPTAPAPLNSTTDLIPQIKAMRENLLRKRGALEQAMHGAGGTLVAHEFHEDLRPLKLPGLDGSSAYELPISISSSTAIWVNNRPDLIKRMARSLANRGRSSGHCRPSRGTAGLYT